MLFMVFHCEFCLLKAKVCTFYRSQIAPSMVSWINVHKHLMIKYPHLACLLFVFVLIYIHFILQITIFIMWLILSAPSRQTKQVVSLRLALFLPRHVTCTLLVFECSYYNLHLGSMLPWQQLSLATFI